MSMIIRDRFTLYEYISFRRYLEQKGYSDVTIYNIIRALNRMIEENGRVLDPDEVKDEYWNISLQSRKKLRYAAKKYQEYRKKVKKD